MLLLYLLIFCRFLDSFPIVALHHVAEITDKGYPVGYKYR